MKEYMVIEKLGNREHEIVLLRTDNFKKAKKVFILLGRLTEIHGYETELSHEDNVFVEDIEAKLFDLDENLNWRDHSPHDMDEPYVPEIMNVRVVSAETCKSSD